MCVVGGMGCLLCICRKEAEKRETEGSVPSRADWPDLEQAGRGGVEIWLHLSFEGPVELVSLCKAHCDLGNVLWLFENDFRHIFLLVTHPPVSKNNPYCRSCSLEEQVSQPPPSPTLYPPSFHPLKVKQKGCSLSPETHIPSA